MTARASGCESGFAARGIAFHRRQPWEALALHLGADGDSRREKCKIRDDVVHIFAGGVQTPTVHAALEAVVDSVFDQIDFSASRAVLRKSRVAPHPRHGVATQTAVEVTAGAAEGVTDVAGQAVTRGE